MKTLQFQTNLSCGNCVAKVKPLLDKEEKIASWSVDLQSPMRTLTLNVDDSLEQKDIQNLVEKVGFEATPQ